MFCSRPSLQRPYKSPGEGHSVSQTTNSGWKRGRDLRGKTRKYWKVMSGRASRRVAKSLIRRGQNWNPGQARPQTGWGNTGKSVHLSGLSFLICEERALLKMTSQVAFSYEILWWLQGSFSLFLWNNNSSGVGKWSNSFAPWMKMCLSVLLRTAQFPA